MSITRLTTNGLTGTKYDTVSADNYYMEPIATTLLSGTAASVTFSNIPQNYKHLQVRVLCGASTGASVNYRFNSDSTATNYYYHRLQGTGAAVNAAAGNLNRIFDYAGLSSTFTVGVIDILDYSNVYKFKTSRALAGNDANGSGQINLTSNLWSNTAAVTSIELLPDTGTWIQYSRFSLYGIRG